MARLGHFLINCSRRIINYEQTQVASCFIVFKRSRSNDSIEPPKPENPVSRTVRILKNDLKTYFSMKDEEDKDDLPNKEERIPSHCDILVIGGGVIGSSIAYWLKQRAPQGIDVAVVERDPSVMSISSSNQYTTASTVLSVGGLRQQFSLKENIEMSMFGAEFFRNIKQYLSIEGVDPPDVQFTPNGYLFLATEEKAEQLEKNVALQKSLGVKNELLSRDKLKQKFPWLNVEDIALGCHGLENEGWIDPWSLLHAFKAKSINLGTTYVHAEAVGFEFKEMGDIILTNQKAKRYQALDKLLVRTENGDIHSIKFAIAIIAAGAHSAKIAEMARIGSGPGDLSNPLPVEPRKRFVYCFHCPDGPGLNTPMVIDHTGTYFRREGLAGHYICGKCPSPENEPSIENMDVDYDFFDQTVWPDLATRVPAFEGVKVKSAWSGFYEYNTFDQNAIVGPHPYYYNLYVATGFSGHGLQQAPAVGRAVMEMILDGGFETIDLTRLGFSRLIDGEKMEEENIW